MGISYGGDQPALHRADSTRRSLAAISPLSVLDAHADDALSGRHPQHRLRGRLGEGAPVHEAKPASAQRRAALGLPADPGRRPDLQGQPGAARRGGRTCWRRSAPTTTTRRRWPTRCRRSPSSTRSTCPCSWPASGPTSRPAATARLWPSTSPARAASGSRSPTAPTSTRSTRTTFNRWYDFLELYVAHQAPITNSAAIHAAAPVIYQEAMGITGRDACRPTRSSCSRPTRARWRRSSSCQPIRVLFDNGAGGPQPGQPAARLRALVRRASRSRAPRAAPGTCRTKGAPERPAARPSRRGLVQLGRPRDLPLTDFTGDTAAGTAASGPPRRRTTGRRTRPGAPSPT